MRDYCLVLTAQWLSAVAIFQMTGLILGCKIFGLAAGAQSGALGQCAAAAASREAKWCSWLVLFGHKPWKPVAEGDHQQSGRRAVNLSCCLQADA